MARRRPTKNIKEVRPTIIGAGITEQWYFTHLQSLFGLKIKIRPRYFGHETMNLLAKRIEQVLSDEGKAVVVFDTDPVLHGRDLTAMYGKPLRRLDLHPTSNSFFVSRRQLRCRYGSGREGSLEITTTLSYTSPSQSR